MAELVEVRARDCACPNTPHAEEGDIVYMLPRPSLDLGLSAHQIMMDPAGGSDNDRIRAVMVDFVRHGAVGWNLLDADGHMVPFVTEDLLADFSLAYEAGERGSDIYTDLVLRPLQKAPSAPSRRGRTTDSTSRRGRSTGKRPESSSPVALAASQPSPT